MGSAALDHKPEFTAALQLIRQPQANCQRTFQSQLVLTAEPTLPRRERLLQGSTLLAQEQEHRLINGLQLIAGLLSRQSRAAPVEAVGHLVAAAGRVVALARVHRLLHLLDHQDKVEFGQYLQSLCDSLRTLLFEERAPLTLRVEVETIEIATAFAIPLGFILNELITNSVKYAQGNVTIQFASTSPSHCSLSVADDGPGLPASFDPISSSGLGMSIVQSLVKQIAGELQIAPGDNGRGVRFTVTFVL
jgi:two-component sensor histidine kinase